MRDRRSGGARRATALHSGHAGVVDAARATAGDGLAATHKAALWPTYTASRVSDAAPVEGARSEASVNPAGVPDRQTGFQPADQTPAGVDGESEAPVVLRRRSVVGMTSSPEGSLPGAKKFA